MRSWAVRLVYDEISWEDKLLFLREFAGPCPSIKHKLLVLQTVLEECACWVIAGWSGLKPQTHFSCSVKHPVKDLNGIRVVH